MDEAAQRIDGDKPKISRIENGKLGVRRLEVEALLELYGVADERLVSSLVTLARQGRKKSWWHQYSESLNAALQESLDLEEDTVRILAYQPFLVPGFVQTPEYAESVVRNAERTASGEQIQNYLSVRMERQKLLRGEKAPQYVCVLDEAVLHRQIGGSATLAAQLRALVEVNSPPELTIQVIPFQQGWHAGLDGGFRIYSYPDPMDMDVVCVEYMDGTLYLEEDVTVDKYRMAFDQLRASALSSRETVELISRLARDLDR
jgi:hypothetical protein